MIHIGRKSDVPRGPRGVRSTSTLLVHFAPFLRPFIVVLVYRLVLRLDQSLTMAGIHSGYPVSLFTMSITMHCSSSHRLDGHLIDFPHIRVDCFTAPPKDSPWLLPTSGPSKGQSVSITVPNAQLYLLTHVHSDHLLGLSDSFTGQLPSTASVAVQVLRASPLTCRPDHLHSRHQTDAVTSRGRSGPQAFGRWNEADWTPEIRRSSGEGAGQGNQRRASCGYDRESCPLKVTTS